MKTEQKIPEWIYKAAEELEGLGRHYPLVQKTARIINDCRLAEQPKICLKDIQYCPCFGYFLYKDGKYLNHDGSWDTHCLNGWFKSKRSIARIYK